VELQRRRVHLAGVPAHPTGDQRLLDGLQAGGVPARRPGVTKTHSRPHTSTDYPYCEAQFRTPTYRPDFPEQFGCVEDARTFCRRFFRWDNSKHRRSGIAWHTPHSVHYGQSEAIRAARADIRAAAYTRNPERFVRQHPEPAALHAAAWINKPPDPRQTPDHSMNP
jgi:putative transposase